MRHLSIFLLVSFLPLWLWFKLCFLAILNVTSIAFILVCCERSWSTQIGDMLLAAITDAIWVIWSVDNHVYFHDIHLNLHNAISLDIVVVHNTVHTTIKKTLFKANENGF